MTCDAASGAPETAADARDVAVVAGQLGRAPRDVTGIAARCRFGFPAVIETAPIWAGGKPNPTLLYLTCPALCENVSRMEAGGGVRAFKARYREDQILGRVVDEVTDLYRARRAYLADAGVVGFGPASGTRDPRLEAGIGGPTGPERASCLHAYAAAFLAVRSGWLAWSEGSASAEMPASGEGRRGSDLAADVEELWHDIFSGIRDPWCVDRRCARWAGSKRRAVIDVGTISVRLLVADVADCDLADIARHAEVTRLGEGLGTGLGGSPRLSPEARERTAAAVRRFVEEARKLGAETIIVAGTSAARDAEDGEIFIENLGREHDAEAFVVTGEEEAALAYSGASLGVGGDLVVLDVGGGSTELIHKTEDGILDWVSLALGASRGTEEWLMSDPPRAAELAQARRKAQAVFDGLRDPFGAGAAGTETRTLVGVAGTVTTLACLDAGLKAYDADAIHLWVIERDAVGRLLEELSAMTASERAALPCVQAGRAPVIVAGAVIVQAALDALGFDRLVVSGRDLLDGLMLRGPC